MRKFFGIGAAVLAVAAFSSSPALAGHAGEFGFGLLYADTAPIGIMYGVNDDTILHVGLGVDVYDVATDSGLPKSRFAVAAALEYDLWSGENWGFGLFPGVAFQSTSFEDVAGTSRDSATLFHVAANLGGHWDMGDHVTFYLKHGISIDIADSGAPNSESTTDFSSMGYDLGAAGFTFWLP